MAVTMSVPQLWYCSITHTHIHTRLRSPDIYYINNECASVVVAYFGTELLDLSTHIYT